MPNRVVSIGLVFFLCVVVAGCQGDSCRQLGSQLTALDARERQITIETRFLTVRDDFMRDVGIDFRGLGDLTSDLGGFGGAGVANAGLNTVSGNLIGGQPGTDVLISSGNLGFLPHVHNGSGGQTGAFVCTPGVGCVFVPDQLVNRVGNDNDSIRSRILNANLGFGGTALAGNFIDDAQLNLILNAVDNDSQSNVITAPQITVYNNQRANISVRDRGSFIQDFNDDIAGVLRAADPEIQFVQHGITLDIRPIVDANGGFIRLEVRPSIALVTDLPNRVNQMTVTLPTVVQGNLSTSIQLDSGQTVLIGGLIDRVRNETTEGVPFLGDLPFLGRLFKDRETRGDQRNLMVLVRATITNDPVEQ